MLNVALRRGPLNSPMKAAYMKTPLAMVAALLLFASHVFAQEARPEPTQNPDAPYRLFNTKNIFTLLKLDTRDGRIWQLQFGDKDYRFVEPLSVDSLAGGGKVGRFTLYPTSHIYTFILLDQETGDSWQVQWGKTKDRFIVPIKALDDE
jgi:hypothetical protein